MKMNFKIISLLFIICLMSISIVSATEDVQADATDLQAADDVDNVIADDDTGQATNDTEPTNNDAPAEPQQFQELQAMIKSAKAGSTIYLNCDYYYSSEKCISIDKSVTIDGNGHTLDGKKTERILAVRHSDVILQNIVFKNGKSDSGAAILGRNGGTKEDFSVTIINCTFINNVASDNGGAFYSQTGKQKFINCTFDSNSAKSGGAISINGDNNIIKDCTFTKNKASGTNGGAIVFSGKSNKNNKITGNTFTENTAAGDGGAIYLQYGNADQIIGNTFNKNSAKIAGAVSLYKTGYSTLTDNTFTSNKATSIGGAVRYNIANSKSKTTISGNKFKSNTAPNSGALHIDGSNVEISSNDFDNNKATTGYAGSIQFNGNTLKIIKNTITNTNAKTNGGAIVVKTGTSITIKSNNIANAKAKNGGAIHVESGAAKIESNTFTKCSATYRGGAIKADTRVTVTGNTFKNNKATNRGVDVFIYNSAGSEVKSNKYTTSTSKSLVIIKASTKITSPAKTFKKSKTKKVVITLKSGKFLVKNQKVTIKINKKTFKGTTNNKGKATIKIKLTKKGTFKGTLKFAGNSIYKASKGTVKIKIK